MNKHLKFLPIAGVFTSFIIAVAACSSSGEESPAPGKDAGTQQEEGGNLLEDAAPKPDPPPRPIDETPKPQQPDKADPPVLTSIAPEKGFVGGIGPVLVVTGKSFVPRSIVQLEGQPLATSFTSATELKATIPTAKLAAVARLKVSVTTPAPGGGASADVVFAIENPKPEVTALNPLSVLAGAGNTLLTVTGSAFVPGAKIQIGTTELTTTFKSESQLEGTITSSLLTASVTLPVKVLNPIPGGGTSTPIAFTISNPGATVTSISPDTGAIGTENVLTVKGTGYVPTSQVIFNGTAMATTYVAVDQLSAIVPATAVTAPGALPVSVLNPPPGGGPSAPLAYNINYPVATTSLLSPTKVMAGANPTEITVTGTKFFPTSFITFNDVPAATTFVDDKKLKATVDAPVIAMAGIVKVRVVNPTPGGGPSDPRDLLVENGVPDMTGILPSGIPMGSDDTMITVTGTGFVPGSQVRIRGTTLLDAVYIDGSHLTTVIKKAELVTGGTSFPVRVVNPSPGGGPATNYPKLFVLCDSAGANVLLEKTTQALTLDFATFPKVPRWAATGGQCPNVPLFPVDQPAYYAVVQNITTEEITMSAWAVCPDGGKGDAFLAFYKGGKVPTTDAERKACTGDVSEGGSNKSPESGGSNFCPGFTKANGGILLKACERAVVQIQTLKVEDPAYASPTALKVKGE